MSEAGSSRLNWAVIVPSCDAYKDTWPLFFHFLFKFWPDVNVPVYLFTNHHTYQDDRVISVPVGKDEQWSSNLRKALPHVKEDLVFVLLDDFFLNAPVDPQLVQETLRDFQALNADYLAVDKFAKPGKKVKNSLWNQVTKDNLVVGLNASLWRKSHLAKIAVPGLNIWKAENIAKQLAKNNPEAHYYFGPDSKPLITYQESIKGYFWKPSSLEFLKSHNLKADLKWRPCPPQGKDFFSKLIRSYYKRRMKARQLYEDLKYETKVGETIRPL
jgi:hypothetical protein